MKGNTPKLIQTMCDDIEAAEADVRSGDPELQLHGFTALIAIMRDQAALIGDEIGNHPEGQRMAAFVQKRMDDLEVARAAVARVVEQKREADARREEWRKEAAEREARRKAREKAERAEQRRQATERAAKAAEAKRVQDAKDAEEDARQGRLFREGSE